MKFFGDPAVTPKQFYVIGERGSGTNFVDHALKTCLEINSVNTYGWKHGFPTYPAYDPSTLYVLVVRNVMDWIKSLYRRPHETGNRYKDVSFSQFIRMKWEGRFNRYSLTPERIAEERIDQFKHLFGGVLQYDRDPITGKRFANPMKLRTAKMKAHYSMVERVPNFCVVPYVTAKSDPMHLMEQIGSKYSLNIAQEYSPPKTKFGHFQETPSWRVKETNNISESDRSFILDEIDKPFEDYLGLRTKF